MMVWVTLGGFVLVGLAGFGLGFLFCLVGVSRRDVDSLAEENDRLAEQLFDSALAPPCPICPGAVQRGECDSCGYTIPSR